MLHPAADLWQQTFLTVLRINGEHEAATIAADSATDAFMAKFNDNSPSLHAPNPLRAE